MEDIKEITAAESHISTSTVHEQQSFSLFKIQPEPTVLSSLITEEDLSGLLQALRDNVCSSIQAIFIEAPDILVIVPETIHVWDMEGLDRTEAHCEGLTVLCPVQAFALSLGKVKFNWPSATGDGDLDAIIPYLFGRIRREIAGILVSIYTQILIKQGQLVDKYYFLQCGSGPSPAPSRSPHGVDCAPCANCTGQSTRTQTSAGPTSIKMPGKQDNDEYDDDDELRQPSRKKRKLLLSSSFSCPLESNYGCTWSTAEYHRIKYVYAQLLVP